MSKLAAPSAEEGHRFVSRFPTRAGYLHVRLPWTAFRSEAASSGKAEAAAPATLDPEQISYIGLRYLSAEGSTLWGTEVTYH